MNPIVLVTHLTEKKCLHCEGRNRSSFPGCLQYDGYFRPRLEASIVFLNHQNPFLYEQIVDVLRGLFDLEISEGGTAAIIARAGKPASDCAAEICQATTPRLIVQSDETRALVKGRSHCYSGFDGQSDSGRLGERLLQRTDEGASTEISSVSSTSVSGSQNNLWSWT